jgi:hypothetical protein
LESLGNHDRLLENLLLHVVRVIALLDRRGCRSGLDDFALHRAIVTIENLNSVAAHDRPIALVEVGNALRPRRDGQCVRAEVILSVAVPDGQWRPHARADDQVRMIAEQDGDRERTGEARKHGGDGVLG